MKMNDHSSSESVTFPEDEENLADIYRFLALTMRYPDADTVTADFFVVWENIISDLFPGNEIKRFRQLRENSSSFLDDLRIEYTRLFINAIPRTIAPPFASVYQDGDGSIQSRFTEKTRDWYRSQGFDIRDTSIPADHICYELEFLAALVGAGRFADEADFLDTMFRPWFTKFKQRVLEESGHPFYRMSTRLIDFFTKEEQ